MLLISCNKVFKFNIKNANIEILIGQLFTIAVSEPPVLDSLDVISLCVQLQDRQLIAGLKSHLLAIFRQVDQQIESAQFHLYMEFTIY